MKSVLIITPFFRPNIGGVETHLDDLCGYLDDNGFKADVLTYYPLTNTAERIARFEQKGKTRIHRFWWFGVGWFPKLERYPLLDFLYVSSGLFVYSLLFMLKKHREVSVIHTQGLNAGFIGVVLSKIFRKKHILSFHTIYRLSERGSLAAMARPILKMADKILVLGKSGKEDLIQIGILEEKVTIYDYWLEDEFFSPRDQQASRRLLGLPNDLAIGLFVGRFVDSKLPEYLIDAVKNTRSENLLFLFIGTGPNEKYIKELIQIKKNVFLLGKVPNKRLPDYYAAADFLIWGPTDKDYLGRVSMEAVSCGLPVVLANKANFFGIYRRVEESVIGKDNGFFVSPESSEMSKLYDSLADKRDLLSAMKQNCRDFGMHAFSKSNARIITENYEGG